MIRLDDIDVTFNPGTPLERRALRSLTSIERRALLSALDRLAAASERLAADHAVE